MDISYLKYLFFNSIGKWLNFKGKGLYHFNDLSSATPLLESIYLGDLPIESLEHNEELYTPFILLCSPTQRSGTNFLSNVLELSEDIYIPENAIFPPEHFVISHSDVLLEYVHKTIGYWSKWVTDPEQIRRHKLNLVASIGEGVLKFFSKEKENHQTLMLRTPDAGNLENFLPLFPNGKIIAIVRDGRDTVDSFIRSFSGSWAFKKMCGRWALRLDYLYDLKERLDKNSSHKLHIVKYENLNTDPKKTVMDILAFLDIDKNSFNWDQLEKIPVVGSSTMLKTTDKNFWESTSKRDPSKFSNKWRKWSSHRKKAFKRIAGKQLIRAGYESGTDW